MRLHMCVVAQVMRQRVQIIPLKKVRRIGVRRSNTKEHSLRVFAPGAAILQAWMFSSMILMIRIPSCLCVGCRW